MARKSTSPMKLPSNLKIGGNGTSNNSKRSKTKCSSRIKGNTNAPNNSEIKFELFDLLTNQSETFDFSLKYWIS